MINKYNISVLFFLFILVGCQKYTKYLDYYIQPTLKRVNRKWVYESFYVGKYNKNYDKNILFYNIDIKEFNKEDLIKYFIIAYNKRYKTDYNAMLDIEVSDFVLSDNTIGPFYVKGVILRVHE